MPQKKKKTRKEARVKKFEFWKKVWDYLGKYNKVLIGQCKEMSTKIVHELRQSLRQYGAVILMGKNTLIKAAIRRMLEEPKIGEEDYEIRRATFRKMPELENIIDLLKGYSALIFCNGNFSEIKALLKSYNCRKAAKIGAIAPADVILNPGPTGMDPKQTTAFQALNIVTKIINTQIDIITPAKLISQGSKMNASECSLLEKLGIRPFVYEIKVVKVYDNGNVYDGRILDISKEDVFEKMRKGANYLTGASLHAGYHTKFSVRHSLMRGFKHLLACSMEVPYDFEQAIALKEAMSKAPQQAAPAKVEQAVVEEKKEEVKEEEAIGGLEGIFGADDE